MHTELEMNQSIGQKIWSQISLPYLSVDYQKKFYDYFAEQTLLSLRVTMPVTCILHAAMMISEARVFPEHFFVLFVYHIFVIMGCAFLFIVSCNRKLVPHAPDIAVLVWIFAAVAVSLAVSVMKSGIFFYIVGVVFTLFYICSFIRSTFKRAMYCCLFGLIALNLALYTTNHGINDFLFGNFTSGYAIIIGLSSCYVMERLERKSFLLQMHLEREKEKSDDHSAWLRQLATFLRHEVRQPIAQINSSVELCAIKSQADPNLTAHLLDATRAAQHVWHLIERASRATDAEAYVRESRPEKVDLRQFVASLVDGFRKTHSGVSFELGGSAAPEVRADPAILKEAVSNLLSNAASFADEETTVTVSVDATDGKAVVKVRNEGPLLEGDTEALFQPFASSRSDGSDDHHGLGLYLVRLIAQQHRGAAVIANRADGRGVEASLVLPATS